VTGAPGRWSAARPPPRAPGTGAAPATRAWRRGPAVSAGRVERAARRPPWAADAGAAPVRSGPRALPGTLTLAQGKQRACTAPRHAMRGGTGAAERRTGRRPRCCVGRAARRRAPGCRGAALLRRPGGARGRAPGRARAGARQARAARPRGGRLCARRRRGGQQSSRADSSSIQSMDAPCKTRCSQRNVKDQEMLAATRAALWRVRETLLPQRDTQRAMRCTDWPAEPSAAPPRLRPPQRAAHPRAARRLPTRAEAAPLRAAALQARHLAPAAPAQGARRRRAEAATLLPARSPPQAMPQVGFRLRCLPARPPARGPRAGAPRVAPAPGSPPPARSRPPASSARDARLDAAGSCAGRRGPRTHASALPAAHYACKSCAGTLAAPGCARTQVHGRCAHRRQTESQSPDRHPSGEHTDMRGSLCRCVADVQVTPS